MNKNTISAVLAVKNEEQIIAKCLDHISWVDEIIIIDNGSTDRTVDICKKYTAKIYSIKEKMLIPLLQNEGIKRATKEWVLILDADVIVPKEAAVEIQSKINTEDYDGYYLLHKIYIAGRFMKSPFWSFNILKLFKKGTAHFEGNTAHEAIHFDGNVSFIKNPLFHYAHPSFDAEIRKLNLYSSQDAEIIHKKKRGGILKRSIKKITLYQILVEPAVYSIYLFFQRKGYKDGIHGIIVDVLMGFYIFIESAKVWEFEQVKKIEKVQ